MTYRIAIIGGGISGTLSALKLAELSNVSVDVFEKRSALLSGGPWCHLHSGGFLYPSISLQDCQTLLHHSLLFAEKFRDCIIPRPTIIALRKSSKFLAKELVYKCEFIQSAYSYWIATNQKAPLGIVDLFSAIYTREDILHFKQFGKFPESYNNNKLSRDFHNPYVASFCQLLQNIDDIQYPFISVCEFGVNQAKVIQELVESIDSLNNVNVFTNTKAVITRSENYTCWAVNGHNYDFLVNAAGCYSLEIFPSNQHEILELKSSWLVQNDDIEGDLPEIAIIGERGTPNGMIQITPHANGLFQIHCMTQDSTLIDSTSFYSLSTQNIESYFPRNVHDIVKNDKLNEQEIYSRSKAAIDNVSAVLPKFSNSIVINQNHFWGIQRIPFTSKEKRISRVVFPHRNYAELRVVKAISTVSLVSDLLFHIDSLRYEAMRTADITVIK